MKICFFRKEAAGLLSVPEVRLYYYVKREVVTNDAEKVIMDEKFPSLIFRRVLALC